MSFVERDRGTQPTTDVWMTPPYILKSLGEFDLDPCAAINQPWPTAHRHYTKIDNGLTKHWRGRVWMNPPYGDATKIWLAKLASHNNGIALTFARTETRMFFDSVWPKATALLFLKGRIHFHYPNGKRSGSAGAASVLIAYGKENAMSLKKSGLKGAIVIPHVLETKRRLFLI